MKILIVDDSTLMRKMIKDGLLARGIRPEVIEAKDGLEALGKFKEHYKSLTMVFCDWSMPKMNGMEFIKSIKNIDRFSSVPIIIISSDQTKNKMDEAKKNGVLEYIGKPFTNEAIALAFEKALKVSRNK